MTDKRRHPTTTKPDFSEEQLTEKPIPDHASSCKKHLADLVREHPDRARRILRHRAMGDDAR